MLRLSEQINEIIVDHKFTGLRLEQRKDKTVVHTLTGEYREINLPHRRYLHIVDDSLDDGRGLVGLNQLEIDLRALGEI